jgi:hypothetical protein
MSADKRKAVADGYRPSSIYASTRTELSAKRDKAMTENPDKKYRTIATSSGYMLYEKYKAIKGSMLVKVKEDYDSKITVLRLRTDKLNELNEKMEAIREEIRQVSIAKNEAEREVYVLKNKLKDSGIDPLANEKAAQ